MAVITYLGTDYTVDHAVKGADYIHGYDANAVMIVSFEGISDFSLFSYNGNYMAPDHCLAEGCNDVRCVGGVLVTRDGKSVSTTVEATLLASGWADGVYTLSVDGVTANSNQEILPALGITTEQLEALQGANIQDGGQTAGNITLKAFGDVPTIDIPIRVIKRGD